jgi:hypothetical protein
MKKERSLIIISVFMLLQTINIIQARKITIKNTIPQTAKINQIIMDYQQQIRSGDLFGRPITEAQIANVNKKTKVKYATAVVELGEIKGDQTLELDAMPEDITLEFNYPGKSVPFTLAWRGDVCLSINDKMVRFCPEPLPPMKPYQPSEEDKKRWAEQKKERDIMAGYH